jgi:hypothetical protein
MCKRFGRNIIRRPVPILIRVLPPSHTFIVIIRLSAKGTNWVMKKVLSLK